MSGGRFDYKQYYIHQIADDIESIIENNDAVCKVCEKHEAEFGYTLWHEGCIQGYGYDQTVVELLKEAVYQLRKAHIYAQRVDWLLSLDDGPDNFKVRLLNELTELNTKYPRDE